MRWHEEKEGIEKVVDDETLLTINKSKHAK